MQYSRKAICLILVFVAVFFTANLAMAQDFMLVQIPSSDVQIKAARSVGDEKTANVYVRSDNQIKNAIIKDFRTNFSFCHVYFFETKDLDLVKAKDFKRTTFYNQNGIEAKLPAVTNNYKIANISFYPVETVVVSEKENETLREETGVENHLGLGIILRDETYEPVTGKLRFTACKIGKRGSVFKKNKRYYVFWGSKAFNRKMEKFGN